MAIELLYLKTFVKVVQCGSYTHAALKLGYAQSSITNHIQKLEEQYGGITLLERRGKSMKPTPSGELLYEYAEKILSLHQESHMALQKQEIKTISIGTIETLAIYCLPRILEQFKEQYPDVLIRIIPDCEENIIRRVNDKEIDFGFILDSPCIVPEIESLSIQKERMAVVVPFNHLFENREAITLNDLENQSLLLTEKGCTYRAFLLEKLKKHGVPYNVSMELSSVETIKKAVQNEWGIGFLPDFTIAHDDPVKAIHFANEEFDFYRQLIYKKEKTNQKVFNLFISLFNE
ncbi:LysR family transcriptional regulator [Halalkalibacterium halodurans]|uniref:LysR family transcriptional regulator n=1 Tax=Halalkalibacterium halodurans TaxID=86665 RepID=UPI0010FEDFE5|nr:LysR family transcriptional regulator [Halalkalibacterium halodurans]MED3648863.1 LysR family transcriptional regulator [Halalkalibacterium halodurans]